MSPRSRSNDAARALAIALLLSAAVLLTFSRVADHQFLPDYDDEYYVTENPQVLQGLTLASIRWAFTTTYAAFWHPVTWLSHMADVTLFGQNPAGHHLAAVLLHLAGTLALFFVLRGLTGALWRSALVAALFAVHPLHVESVAWVSERKDVLCALFWFLGLGAYLRYARRPGLLRYTGVFVAYAAAVMSKSMAVTFPFVLLLLDFWPLDRFRAAAAPAVSGAQRRLPRQRVWLEKIPFVLLIPVVAALSYSAQIEFNALSPWLEYEFWQRLGNAFISYGAYLGKTILPVGLAAYYPHPGPDVSLPKAALSAAFLLLVTGVCVSFARSHPFLTTGWLWYLGTLVPVIGLVQVGQFAMADRYTYLPLVGVFIAVAWGAGRLCDRWRVRIVNRVAVAAVAVAVFAAAAWVQTGYWRDEVTLWTRAVEVTGENMHARMHLGVAWARRGEPERAAGQFREAIRINPNLTQAMDLLADMLERMGRHEEAAIQRKKARELETGFRSAETVPVPSGERRAAGRFGARDHNNAGVGEAHVGRYREAEAHFRKALELAPEYAGAHYNLGNLFRDTGRPDLAYAEYVRTVTLDPDFAKAHLNIGVLLRERGDRQGAIAAFEKALRADPDLSAARLHLEAVQALAGGRH